MSNGDHKEVISEMLVDQAVWITPNANVTMIGVVFREHSGVRFDEIQGSFRLRFKPLRTLRTARLVPR